MDGGVKQDPDYRVQYAALNAIGMLCMEQQPFVQLHKHEVLVPAIRGCMKSPSPRVAAHAAGALVNFLEGSRLPQLVKPYVEDLLGDVYAQLSSTHAMVREHAMNALAVLADTAREEFGRLYVGLCPGN